MRQFESVVTALIQPRKDGSTVCSVDLIGQLDQGRSDEAGIARAMNAAFVAALAGNKHPASTRADELLARMADSPQWAETARFYLDGLKLVRREIETTCRRDPHLADSLTALANWVLSEENLNDREGTAERIWSVFFPEATGIRANRRQRVESLRERRTVTVTELNPAPITDPARQLLLTSNVLLTIPPASRLQDDLPLSSDLKGKLLESAREGQLYWYDHPIQMGVEPEKNEAVYGLRGLQAALEFERARGTMSRDVRLTCILSVSVTHRGLGGIAKTYLEEEIVRFGGLRHLDLFAFAEADARQVVEEILAPAAEHYLGRDDAAKCLAMFGVDGNYGRHYSFLKAIAAFWSVFIRPEVKATFKIDLDQVFPQRELVDQAGSSALEHFTTPLWGARGVDCQGQPVELGMIAGAMVNERDIGKSLFTPDVTYPSRAPLADELVFFSVLPQALSTEAEMMTRYTSSGLDGAKRCLQRVHVLGGVNGILIDSLRRHRPFTPSFIGRAEDQAYILSTLPDPGMRLAYVHKDGLIMRHDKEAFAQEAIHSARIGKLIGDYVRILLFSAYAKVLSGDATELKDALGPFTGCFISRIPITVVYLRFALKAASFFQAHEDEQGLEFVTMGAQRIAGALDFVRGENSALKQQYEDERRGWDLYYDTLSAIEDALQRGDGFARDLRTRSERIVQQCSIGRTA